MKLKSSLLKEEIKEVKLPLFNGHLGGSTLRKDQGTFSFLT
ncbi:hypothetical protein PL9631_550004 [Planktothrix paucivesiculata PCC 9631]|uniref:Uncharacterized protein n=1 Tax=Planktothrix paucivesiculata PCC 9631 TaxID=671071 RepID=A0A7Z9BXI7_9CYAN|nr:hypothetical protein PL9631_550004 [Planktothrix paucivesiculata PCC 9631]